MAFPDLTRRVCGTLSSLERAVGSLTLTYIKYPRGISTLVEHSHP